MGRRRREIAAYNPAIPAFYPVIPAFYPPVIPAKAGTRMAARGVWFDRERDKTARSSLRKAAAAR